MSKINTLFYIIALYKWKKIHFKSWQSHSTDRKGMFISDFVTLFKAPHSMAAKCTYTTYHIFENTSQMVQVDCPIFVYWIQCAKSRDFVHRSITEDSSHTAPPPSACDYIKHRKDCEKLLARVSLSRHSDYTRTMYILAVYSSACTA